MKSSCISWPEKEPLVLIRASQVRLCNGNHCAAALLSYFEYWHNIRVEQAEQAEHHNKVAALHGEEGMQDTTFLQYHTEQKIEEGLIHLYGRSTIRKAVTFLVSKGFISLQLNPNQRFHFDRTHYFLFHPDVVQEAIRSIAHDVKIPDGGAKSNAPSVKNNAPERKNNAPIEEITSEITNRDLTSPSFSPSQDTQRCECARDVEAITQMEAGFQAYTPGFESVCLAHPKQPIEGKREAFVIWQLRRLEPRALEIEQKLARLIVTKWRDRTYYPLLKTWLKNAGYDDDLVPLEQYTQGADDNGFAPQYSPANWHLEETTP